MQKTVQSLKRGLLVLRHLSQYDSLDLATVSRLCDLPKPTVLRLLRTMEETGHVRRGQTDGRWRVSYVSRFFELTKLGSVVAEASERPIVELCNHVVWPSDVGVYERGQIRVVESTRLVSPFLTNMDIHRNVGVLKSAMGRAILSWSNASHQKDILREVAEEGSELDRNLLKTTSFEEVFAQTRTQGYAVRAAGYYLSDNQPQAVSAIAVPIFFKDVPIAAITLSWIAKAMTEAVFVQNYLADLNHAKAQIEQGLREF